MAEMKAQFSCFNNAAFNFGVKHDSVNTFSAMHMKICRGSGYRGLSAREQTVVIVKSGESRIRKCNASQL